MKSEEYIPAESEAEQPKRTPPKSGAKGRIEVGNGEDVQESQTTDDSGKVAKLEALNRELAEELEKFTKAVELFIGDGPEVRSSRAILAKTKEVA